jgi:hypothetical protein
MRRHRIGVFQMYQKFCERVESPHPRQGYGIGDNLFWINRSHDLHQRTVCIQPRVVGEPCSRDFAHEAVQADCFGGDRRVALVGDCLAVNEGENTQRRYRLVEPVAGEGRGQWFAKFLAALCKYEEGDRLWREQRGVNDQRLRGGMEHCCCLDRQGKGLRHSHLVVILGRSVLVGVEQPCWLGG